MPRLEMLILSSWFSMWWKASPAVGTDAVPIKFSKQNENHDFQIVIENDNCDYQRLRFWRALSFPTRADTNS